MSLDRYQVEAVNSNYKNTLVVAAPGSGKTTVIINRVKYLIEEKRVKPRNIIVITFTKAAAINMKERYKRLYGEEESPFFGTFHGLCYKILFRYYGQINIINSNDTFRIVSRTLSQFADYIGDEKIKEAINNISLYKCSFLPIEEFKPSIDKEVFQKCYDNYEEYKASKGLFDFDDLQIEVKNIFEKNIELLNSYKRLFKHILVDEFQDCDLIQIKLLQMLNETSNTFAVGDEDQCIYTFRGSKPECMMDFDKYFENGEKIYLHLNYRSKKNIVDISEKLIKNNKLRNEKEIKSFSEDEGIVKKVIPFDENLQCNEIADKIKDDKNLNGVWYKNHAVLYRTNLESRSLIDSFIRKKIPFFLLDKEYNFFHHFICRDLIAYLSLSVNEGDKDSFVRIINKPFRYISKSTLEKIKNHSIDESAFNIIERYQDMKSFQLNNLDRVRKDINYLNKISLSGTVDLILNDLGYMDYLKEYTEKFKGSIDEFEEIINEFRSSLEGFKSIITFLVHVQNVEEEMAKGSRNKPNEDRVILSTIHGVKGMEFKNVHIINCCNEYIPHKRSIENGENLEEERRLFYVGVTRAIDNLYIYAPKRIKGEFLNISPFVTECNIEEKIDYCGYEENEEVMHKAYGKGRIKEIKENIIKISFDDVERTFNFTVLINNKLINRIN